MARPEARGTSDGVWREGKRDTPRLFRGRLKREEGRRKSQWLPGAPPASSMEACPVVTVPLGIHRSHTPCPRISPWGSVSLQFPFPRWLGGKESACISIPRWGRSPGGGKGNPLWSSCLGNPKDRGNPWQATVQGSQRVRHDQAHMHASKPLYTAILHAAARGSF